jgi:hypothetical protein
MINLDHVHPVFDGRWHRVLLRRLPQPGEEITTFCGRVEVVEYVSAPDAGVTKTCWACDLQYRRREGIPVLTTHPELLTR